MIARLPGREELSRTAEKIVTREYHPILGNVLGYWKTERVDTIKITTNIELDLEDNEEVILNGRKVWPLDNKEV